MQYYIMNRQQLYNEPYSMDASIMKQCHVRLTRLRYRTLHFSGFLNVLLSELSVYRVMS